MFISGLLGAPGLLVIHQKSPEDHGLGMGFWFSNRNFISASNYGEKR